MSLHAKRNFEAMRDNPSMLATMKRAREKAKKLKQLTEEERANAAKEAETEATAPTYKEQRATVVQERLIESLSFGVEQEFIIARNKDDYQPQVWDMHLHPGPGDELTPNEAGQISMELLLDMVNKSRSREPLRGRVAYLGGPNPGLPHDAVSLIENHVQAESARLLEQLDRPKRLSDYLPFGYTWKDLEIWKERASRNPDPDDNKAWLEVRNARTQLENLQKYHIYKGQGTVRPEWTHEKATENDKETAISKTNPRYMKNLCEELENVDVDFAKYGRLYPVDEDGRREIGLPLHDIDKIKNPYLRRNWIELSGFEVSSRRCNWKDREAFFGEYQVQLEFLKDVYQEGESIHINRTTATRVHIGIDGMKYDIADFPDDDIRDNQGKLRINGQLWRSDKIYYKYGTKAHCQALAVLKRFALLTLVTERTQEACIDPNGLRAFYPSTFYAKKIYSVIGRHIPETRASFDHMYELWAAINNSSTVHELAWKMSNASHSDLNSDSTDKCVQREIKRRRNYFTVNWNKIQSHGILETRMFPSTKNAEEVEMWIRFCCELFISCIKMKDIDVRILTLMVHPNNPWKFLEKFIGDPVVRGYFRRKWETGGDFPDAGAHTEISVGALPKPIREGPPPPPAETTEAA